jgi:hypothetical protein
MYSANIRMVVASADDSTDLHKLANMADKVEVATPTVAALSGDRPTRTDVSEMELLREEVARLADLVSTLQLDLVVEIHPDHAVLTVQPHRFPRPRTHSVGIMQGLVKRPRNARKLLQGQSLAVTGATGPNCSRLFHVHDANTHMRFLVDTGSEVSVLPPSSTDRQQPDKLSLTSVNNTLIATYGKRSLTINLGLRTITALDFHHC